RRHCAALDRSTAVALGGERHAEAVVAEARPMMLDLRYHLVSLTAVFLALTVGIVVGGSLGSSEQQKTVVQRLEQKFQRVMDEDRRIQTEDDALRHRLAAREHAERLLLPELIQDRLAGVRLAVVI